MVEDSGEFICPKCNNNGTYEYIKWISKNSFSDNRPIKVWIFYREIINESRQQKSKFTNWDYFYLPWSIAREITNENDCDGINACLCYLLDVCLSSFFSYFI